MRDIHSSPFWTQWMPAVWPTAIVMGIHLAFDGVTLFALAWLEELAGRSAVEAIWGFATFSLLGCQMCLLSIWLVLGVPPWPPRLVGVTAVLLIVARVAAMIDLDLFSLWMFAASVGLILQVALWPLRG